MASKRVLVTGGRYFNEVSAVHDVLSNLHARFGIAELGEGGATGADELSKLWACAFNVPVRTFEANWKLYGNRAGVMRNSSMLREFKPDFAVAFPGGAGTNDMVQKLADANIPFLRGVYSGGDEGELEWKLYNG